MGNFQVPGSGGNGDSHYPQQFANVPSPLLNNKISTNSPYLSSLLMTSNNKNQSYNNIGISGQNDGKKYKQESSQGGSQSRHGMQGQYDDFKGREYKSNPVKTFFSANQNKVLSQKRQDEASQSRKKEFMDNNEKSSQQNTPTLNTGEHQSHLMPQDQQFQNVDNRNYSFSMARNSFAGFDQEQTQKN